MLPDRSFPLVDAHVHLMPERLLEASRAYLRAHHWHPIYTGAAEALVADLLAAGIDGFVFGSFAHRPGLAQSLNHWTANVQRLYAPGTIGLATFHPADGPSLERLVDEAFGPLGLAGVTLHPASGEFNLDDPRLDPLYQRASGGRLPVYLHAGRRPEPSERVGVRAVERVLRRFPDLPVVLPSLGADEFGAAAALCERYPNVFLDTAYVLNRHLGGPPPAGMLVELQDRVMFGSGFPLAPYRVERAIEALLAQQLGPVIETKLLCSNVGRLFNLGLEALVPPAF